MRAVNVRVSASEGWFGPFHRGVVESSDVTLVALHELRLLNDESTVMLYEYTGDPEQAEELAREYLSSESIEWQRTTIDDYSLMYAHDTDPSGLLQGLLWLLDNWRVVVDWPIHFPDDDRALVTLIGDEGEIRDGLAHIPEGVDVRIERSGDYERETEGVLRDLTVAERRMVSTAVDVGYYRNPREANYRELAEELDCSTGTVGYHLRNAESKILCHLFG